MADDLTMNSSEDQKVDIVGDDFSEYELKIAELSDDLDLLEKEKNQVVSENKSLNDMVRKMKESMESLSAENEGLKEEVEKLEAENKTLQSVAARAAELEGEVARTQHDLVTATSDLQEANEEIVALKSNLGSLEGGEMEKTNKLDAIVSERDLLLSKVAHLEAKVGDKENEIRALESRIEELKVDARAREELEKKVKDIEGKLVEKDKVLRGLEFDGEVISNGKNAVVAEDVESAAEGKEKGNYCAGLKNLEWPVVVGVATVSAVAVMGTVCYLQYGRRK